MTEYRITTERISLTDMNRVRHYIFCALLIVACAALTVSAVALRTGDIVDYVLKTDIRAFIDGYEIPSYNISNRLGVVAEDLRGYGFDVEWNAESKTLHITKNGYGVTSPIGGITDRDSASLPVYYTDIVTYVNGEAVESFNIGGYTIIYLRELQRYGSCYYDFEAAASMVSTSYHSYNKVTLPELPREIIHAGGEVEGMLGTNSKEALKASYENGYRFIEIDFVLSSDGEPVCLHDWSSYYSDALTTSPISRAEFENIRIFGKYTPLTLDTLATWMRAYKDLYIVTDIKENNIEVLRLISKEHPEIVSRIIPQIYQYEEYAPVFALGYTNIILTLYKLPTYNQKADAVYNAAFAQRHGLLAITADVTLATPEFVSAFTAHGVPLYVHTVNDETEKQKLLDMGVTGVYTDYAK